MLLLYWQEHPGCQITRETVTTDQHDELIKMGIKPTLKGVKWDQKFPYVIFCAPPSRSSEFRLCCISGEIVSLWNGEFYSFYFNTISYKFSFECRHAVNVRHHKVGETEEPAIYRINDDLYIRLLFLRMTSSADRRESLASFLRVFLINDLNVIHSECDLIGNPEPFPHNDTPLVERSTPPIPDEDHVDVKRKKRQSRNDNISKVVEDVSKLTKLMLEKNNEDDVGACIKKLETLKKDATIMTKMMIEKNKEDDVGACLKKLEVFKDVSKMTRMIMEKNKENDVGACFKKLETLEEEVSKLTRMMMEKNKEDVVGFNKLEIL
ncbi:hypothetical protein Tco_1057865 [Tanacetum coccineum]|uniref:Uncharacterized protein n=1 Tax=Tanacetum coccineum TaxID=301880 RepID=A0ABQ5H6L1_9ASTR